MKAAIRGQLNTTYLEVEVSRTVPKCANVCHVFVYSKICLKSQVITTKKNCITKFHMVKEKMEKKGFCTRPLKVVSCLCRKTSIVSHPGAETNLGCVAAKNNQKAPSVRVISTLF